VEARFDLTTQTRRLEQIYDEVAATRPQLTARGRLPRPG
jgi:HAMP domain-containing protein